MIILKIFLMSGLTFFLKWTIIFSLNNDIPRLFSLETLPFLRIYSRSKGTRFLYVGRNT